MRPIHFMTIIIILLVLPTTLLGATKGQTELSFTLGAGIPVGDFGDLAKTGYLVGASIGYYSTPQFAIGGELCFHSFAASDDLTNLTEEYLYYMTGMWIDVDINWSVFETTGYVKYLFTDSNFSPYIKGKGGYYSLKLKVEAAGESADESEGNIGVGAGLGAQFQGSGSVGGFVEGLYNKIFTDGDGVQYFEIRGGINILLGN